MSASRTAPVTAGGMRIPQLELDCMKVLWEVGDCSVAQVRANLSRPLAYTTIMTVLDRMAAKGLVTRQKQGRAFVYAPQLDRNAARISAVRRLLANFFDNDRHALLQYVAGIEHIDTENGRRPQRPSAARPPRRSTFHPAMDETLL